MDYGSLGIGAAGLALGGASSIMNYRAEKDNLNYQKDLQQTIFNREDSSIQRRVADLKLAGLSPVLAAGQGANSGSIIQTKAPEIQGNPLQDAMQLMQMKENISSTVAQKQYLESQSRGRSIENDIAQKDLDSYIEFGTNPRNTTGIIRDIQQVLKMLGGNTVKAIRQDVADKVDPTGRKGESVKNIEKKEGIGKYFLTGVGATSVNAKKYKK